MTYRIEDNIYAKETGIYGKSLFAKRDFKKDELVYVAFGPVVTHATDYTIPINETYRIEPRLPEGNLCQFVCHSCDPNLGIKNRTWFVAFKDIKKDEEIRVDYAMLGFAYGDEITEQGRICRCGSPICRGKLGCYKELPKELKIEYKGYVNEELEQKYFDAE